MAIETRVVRTLNLEACPIPEPPDTTPDPQFYGAITCDQSPIRLSDTGKQRKNDRNADSPNYGQWLKSDLTYSATEGDGELLDVGSQPGSCPLGCYFKIVNSFVPGSPATEYQSTVTLYYDSLGTSVATATESVTFNFSGGVTGAIDIGQNHRDYYNGAGGAYLTFVSVSPSYYTQIF
ncbi:MAG: hypothetical protein V4714_08270 [Bacteroidota bacterium]